MARADDTELIDAFEEFYRSYYRNEIAELAQKYPNEQKSLYIDWQDLYRFDADLADDFRNKPKQLRQYAEEALRLYDLPVDVSLGQAHVRVRNLPEATDIRGIRADQRGMLIAVKGIVRKATDVRPKITNAAFECQRCGTLTRIPQEGGNFQEPHECQGCERQGPFRINYDQSEFIDAQKLRVQESPEGLRGGETPQSIDVNIEDDITGEVTPGDHVTTTGILQLEQQGNDREKSAMFDVYMEGLTVDIEDEQFEEMEISDEDKKEIIELSNSANIYEEMVGAIAPSIYGYEKEKQAMIFQLFSGVTKFLPDGSRTRGDLHILLIGDPGTGKCLKGDTKVTLSDGRRQEIRTLVEENLTDPKPVDDGVYDTVDISLPSLTDDGVIEKRQATKVWKREAPETMYRVETSSGRQVEVTPSHPLFVQSHEGIEPVETENLEIGDHVAVSQQPLTEDDVRWEKITAIEPVQPEYDWVYDLEVAGTHNYISEGIVSHNSQLLQYIKDIAPRSVYTSGKGSSSAGLTAAAVRDDFGEGQQWTLEAGALVLADQGIAAVDELDKMRCVTGETLVHTRDGITPIRELAETAKRSGEIEELPNGKTIRDVDPVVWTMTEDGTIELRDVTAIHEYDAPESVREVTLESGESVTATADHPFFVLSNGERTTKPAEELQEGDWTCVPHSIGSTATDGGTVSVDEYAPPPKEIPTEAADITWKKVEDSKQIPATEAEENPTKVYDLTVEETHNFVANGIVIHNSEDQSAMHEALEQQSYHPNSEVLLADGRRVKIGEFVDEKFEQSPEKVTEGINCELCPVSDTRVHTVDLDTNEVTKTDVDRVSRHEAPDEFVEVTFSNGRTVTVTPEHPMFVDAEGEVGTVEAREIEEGAFVPAPRKLPNSAQPVELAGEPHQGKEKDVTLPEVLSPDLAEILGLLVAEGHSYAGSAHEIGFSNQEERLLERFEGLVASVFDMESSDTTNAAGTVTKRCISTKLYRWFESNFPEVMETARGKRIPAAVLGASEEVIRRFLVGAFAGDGSVESEAMSFSTASEGLAQDYADALSKIGVASRIHYTRHEDAWKTYVMGDSTEAFVEQVILERDERYEKAKQFVERSNEIENLAERSELRYYRVTDVETVPNEGEDACEWVYDVTVEPTNTFVSQGVVLHNSISVSKAGINATLKSRCSLLGAANPTYGRFDEFEPIGEQIDLDPPLISRFDLIFTVTDQPDEEEDARLAEHILQTNYAGELNTHRTETSTSNYTKEEVERITEDVAPTIDAEFLRKYVAYAQRNCYPTMTEEAKEQIQQFYVDLRLQGSDEDAPVPVTARKLEALVRLSEASARVRLSDDVTQEDAQRAIDIARYCLEDIGLDPETGELDADMIETGTSKSQRDRIQNLKQLIATIEEEYDEGAPAEVIVERAEEEGMSASKVEHEIDKLKEKGEVYEPQHNYLRTT